MTCRCKSGEEHAARALANQRDDMESLQKENAKLKQQMSVADYLIRRVEMKGPHMVLEVQYPTCQHREFECRKVMVFLDVKLEEALMWKEIDPHFRAKERKANQAPSPAARFPATPDGWADACLYATRKAAK